EGCWTQYYGSPLHNKEEFYAQDFYCPAPGDQIPIFDEVLSSGAPRQSQGASVYNACGGRDIITTVVTASQSGVVLKHERTDIRKEIGCGSKSGTVVISTIPFANLMAYNSGEPMKLQPPQGKILTVKGLFPARFKLKTN